MLQCSRCNSSGTIVAEHRESKALYAFLCGCDISRRRGLSASIPVWGNKYREKYATEFDAEYVPAPKPVPAPAIKPKEDFRMKQANDFDEEEIPW